MPTEDFDSFYRRDFHTVARAVLLIVGNREEAFDVTQEAFARTWIRWQQLGPPDHLIAFTMRVARNLGKSYLRKLRLLRRLQPQLIDATRDEHENKDLTLPLIVRAALLKLSPRERWAVVLSDALDLQTAESAGILGISESTFRAHLTRARGKLNAEFSKDLEGGFSGSTQ